MKNDFPYFSSFGGTWGHNRTVSTPPDAEQAETFEDPSMSYGPNLQRNFLQKRPSLMQRVLHAFDLRGHLENMANNYPSRLAVVTFAITIVLATALLSLPAATAAGHRAPFVDTLFTATSAVCVTGLGTVDTATYWSFFGQVVIVVCMAIGGLGVMTISSLLALTVSRRIGLAQRMLAASETKSRLGDVGSLLKAVLFTSLTMELTLAVVLFPRFLTLGSDLPHSLWYAIFMSVSIFNNAGFVVMPEGLAPYAGDWWIGLPIAVGTFIGALGFPVILDISRHRKKPRLWTLHTKLTLTTYTLLTVGSAIAITIFEWSNPDTFGALDAKGKLIAALVNGVNTRTSGISTVPISLMNESTWFMQDLMMFIGGGSASTAGGIKVTTLAVLVLAIIAEARGDQDVEAFGRRIPPSAVRLSIAVAFIGAAIVGVSALLLLWMTNLALDTILYETISAFSLVGLSTGITPLLPAAAKYVLIALMYMGRVGTLTIATALAMRERRRVIRMPEERPMIG